MSYMGNLIKCVNGVFYGNGHTMKPPSKTQASNFVSICLSCHLFSEAPHHERLFGLD